MLPSQEKRLLLSPGDFVPTVADWEVIGAFNPGAALVEDGIVLMVRIAERPRERRPGFIGLPRWEEGIGFTTDWIPEGDVEVVDARVVRIRSTGRVRLTSVSHIRVVRCGPAGVEPRQTDVRFDPAHDTEEFGVEDPRITQIDDHYWITYVAVSRHGAATALASTRDFQSFERYGVIFPPENKDVVLFPEKIDGSYVALHRPNGATPFTKPQMWLARSPDLLHWGRHEVLELAASDWDSGRVGAGAPPVRVEGGWLELYHGNRRPTLPGEVGCYQGAGLLLDVRHPVRVLQRSQGPVLTPTEPFEREGFVCDVVFPTALVEQGGSWLIYYGASDAYTAVARCSKESLLNGLAAPSGPLSAARLAP